MIIRLLKEALLCFIILFISSTSANELEKVCPEIEQQMLQKVNLVIDNPSNLLGKGGFGAVFEFEGKALKIVKIEKQNESTIKKFVSETLYSKKLSELDKSNTHFPQFISCFTLNSSVSRKLDSYYLNAGKSESVNTVEPQNKQSSGHKRNNSNPIMTRSNSINSRVSSNVIYVGILMEKLGIELNQLLSEEAKFMDLSERINLMQSLANHLIFLNTELRTNHCDIKPQNFLITELDSPNDSYYNIVLHRFFGTKTKRYFSKLIDFGGTVASNDSCSTITLGYMPIDNLNLNASPLLPGVSSSKNDLFALGSIMGHTMTDKYYDIIKTNLIFQSIIFQISQVEAEKVKEEMQRDSSYVTKLKAEGVMEGRKKLILKYNSDFLNIFKQYKPQFIKLYENISRKSNVKDNDFLAEVVADPEMLTKVMELFFSFQIKPFKTQKQKLAHLEIMRLLYSFGLTKENYNLYDESVQEYLGLNSDFIDFIVKMMAFDDNLKPDWNMVQQFLNEMNERLFSFYSKLTYFGIILNPQGIFQPDYTKFTSFNMDTKQLDQSNSSTHINYRILTATHSSIDKFEEM